MYRLIVLLVGLIAAAPAWAVCPSTPGDCPPMTTNNPTIVGVVGGGATYTAPIINGGTLGGSITGTGTTITGGTFSGITLGGAITATGATVTGGTFTAIPGVSLATCTGCDLTGVADSTSALNTFLTAHTGDTVYCPANAKLLFTTGNVTVPATTALVGAGSPQAETWRNAGTASCTFLHDRTHTLIANAGSRIQWLNVLANDLITNPTAAQVNAAVAAWGTDSSVGILTGTGNGTVIEHVFVMGFNWGVISRNNTGSIRDLYIDSYHGLYNSTNVILDNIEVQPYYCLNSTGCNTVNSARPGTAFYLLLATASAHHLVCEQYTQGVYISGAGGATWAKDMTCEISQQISFNSLGAGPPFNGFGMVGVRAFDVPNLVIKDFLAHGYSTILQLDDGNTGALIDTFQAANPGLSSNTGFVAPVVISAGSAAGTKITITGTATAGATVAVTVSGQAPPPQFAALGSAVSGAIGATTYFVKLTYTGSATETTPSAEFSLAVAANSVLTVASPPPWTGATGYNVYVSTSTGTETLQNVSPIALGTAWQEPNTGLIAGAALPGANTTAWSITDTFNATAMPGVGSANSTIAQFLETMLNTDATLIGNHVNAEFSSNTVSVYAPSALPAITVTAVGTGGLTAATTSTGTKAAPSGVIRAPSSYADPNPTFLKLATGTNWQWDDLPLNSTSNQARYINFQAGFDMFPLWRGSNTTGVTGTGCGGTASNRRDLAGTVTETNAATGCAISVATMPFPPQCNVWGLSGDAITSIVTPTTTGFSWTNASPSVTHSFAYQCTLNY